MIHPGKLTWNLKMNPWKRRFLLKTIIFRFHVRFRGGTTSSHFKIQETHRKRFKQVQPICFEGIKNILFNCTWCLFAASVVYRKDCSRANTVHPRSHWRGFFPTQTLFSFGTWRFNPAKLSLDSLSFGSWNQ